MLSQFLEEDHGLHTDTGCHFPCVSHVWGVADFKDKSFFVGARKGRRSRLFRVFAKRRHGSSIVVHEGGPDDSEPRIVLAWSLFGSSAAFEKPSWGRGFGVTCFG